MTRGLGPLLVLAVGVIALCGATAGAQAPAVPDAARAPSPARIEAGRKVYEREKCASCHQIAGRGNSRFPLDGVGRKLTIDQIRRWITETSRMEDALPRMPLIRMSAQKYRLGAADLDALVTFVHNLR